VTPEDVRRFASCIAAGGIALFPADTVYGLAVDPESRAAVDRLYALKGRPAERPAAVMWFQLRSALDALPELPPRTRAALERVLPGALTAIVPNPGRRFPLACGPEPEKLGLRVPALAGRLAPLATVATPVLQSSANVSGGADPRRLDEVDPAIRAGAAIALDGGDLPGTPSTVVDLSGYEEGGQFRVLREGAIAAEELRGLL
jgi:L-threonylcarbamoyladenylate synthase